MKNDSERFTQCVGNNINAATVDEPPVLELQRWSFRTARYKPVNYEHFEVKVCLTEDVFQRLEHTWPSHWSDEADPDCGIDDENDPPPGALALDPGPQSLEEKEEWELDSEQTGVEKNDQSGQAPKVDRQFVLNLRRSKYSLST